MNGEKTAKGDIESQQNGPEATEPQREPLRFSLRSLLLAVLVICILLGFLVPSIRIAQRAAHRTRCSANLKHIGLAISNYQDVYKAFPWATTYADDGTPMHSWRVGLLPYLEQSSFYDRYDRNEPWDGPKNGLLADEIPDTWIDKEGNSFQMVYDCPSLYRCPSGPKSQNRMCTNYVMLIDDRPGKSNGPPNRPGSAPQAMMGEGHIIILEIADSDIHWMEPRDVLLSELKQMIDGRTNRVLSSYHTGACILRADGSVDILNNVATFENLSELLEQ